MQRTLFTISMYFISLLFMKAQKSAKIRITVGATSFVATTYDNATAKAFIALLPMTFTMNELNGNEKYNYLSGNLPNSPEYPSTIHAGDLMLYGQNCIVLFYETFATSYSYTKIGYIENSTSLKTALGTNNPRVTFELIGNITEIESVEQDAVEFNISSDGLLRYIGNAKKISLIDMNGKVLSSSTSKIIDVNSFPKGIYLLKLEEQNQVKIIKIKI